MTLTVAPLTTTVMESAPPDAVGAASGVNNAVASVAGLLAIASLGLVMSGTFDSHLRGELAARDVSQPIADAVMSQHVRLAAIDAPANTSVDAHRAIRRAVEEAFVSGFRRVMLIGAALALLSAISAWAMIGTTGFHAKPAP